LSNLNGMGKALALYMAANDDRTPLIKMAESDASGVNSAPTPANQTDGDHSSGEWETTLGDQAMQNVWLLVEEEIIDEKVFRCPADRKWRARPATGYGWTSPYQYSYGLHWPYVADAAGNENPAPLVQGKVADTAVIMADRNPGGPVGEDGRKPSNHGKLGTGYLSFDCSVGWLGPDDSLVKRKTLLDRPVEDDIYTNAAGVAGGLPQSATDTSIALSGRELRP
jgi:hypothetical protein